MKIEIVEALNNCCDKALKDIDGVTDPHFLRETFFSFANYIKGMCDAYIVEEGNKK